MAVVVTVGVAPAVGHPGFTGTSSTFTNMNGGVNIPAGSTVVVGVGALASALSNVTSVTMGGTTLTLINSGVCANNAAGFGYLYYGDLAANTTDTCVINYASGQVNYIVPLSAYLTGASTGGPTANAQNIANQSTPYAVTLACPVNGAIFAIYPTYQATAFAPVWTNMSASASDLLSQSTGNLQAGSAHSISASNPSVSGGGGFSSTLHAAAWTQAPVVITNLQPQIWM